VSGCCQVSLMGWFSISGIGVVRFVVVGYARVGFLWRDCVA